MEWIVLKEEQPKESDRYIVSLESGWVGEDYYDAIRKEWFDHQYRVLAWMHRPEPFRREDNECR